MYKPRASHLYYADNYLLISTYYFVLIILLTVPSSVPSILTTSLNSATVQLSCTELQSLSEIYRVTLQLQVASTNNKERGFKDYQNVITCNGIPVDLSYTSLSQNTEYFIVSSWTLNGVPHYCKVTQFFTSEYG